MVDENEASLDELIVAVITPDEPSIVAGIQSVSIRGVRPIIKRSRIRRVTPAQSILVSIDSFDKPTEK